MTTTDTTGSILFEAVASDAESHDEEEGHRRREAWAGLSEWYFKEASNFRSERLEAVAAAGTANLDAHERRSALIAFSEDLDAFEQQCINRVGDSGVLQGVTRTKLRTAAKKKETARRNGPAS